MDEGGCWSANMHIVWLARQSHLITGALREGTNGRSSGSNDYFTSIRPVRCYWEECLLIVFIVCRSSVTHTMPWNTG